MGFIKSKEDVASERKRLAGVDFRDVQQASMIFQTTTEAAQRLLPPPFEPADSSYPTGGVFVAHFGDTSFGIAYEECGL